MATLASKVVPTEYDIEGGTFGPVTLVDDRGRRFTAMSLKRAFRKAEKAQDPDDPIHHPPYPSPKDVPLP